MKWIKKSYIKKFKKTNVPILYCLKCGLDFCDIINDKKIYNYCPHCGEKMDWWV